MGTSPPAPLFSIVVSPSRETKTGNRVKRELAERHRLRLEFRTELLDKARDKTPLHANVSPGIENWFDARAGKTGFAFIYLILKDKASVELYIDQGLAEANKKVFDKFFARKDQFEVAFGGPLVWERLDERRASRIRAWVSQEKGLLDKKSWPEIQEAMIDAMIHLAEAFKKEIRQI